MKIVRFIWFRRKNENRFWFAILRLSPRLCLASYFQPFLCATVLLLVTQWRLLHITPFPSVTVLSALVTRHIFPICLISLAPVTCLSLFHQLHFLSCWWTDRLLLLLTFLFSYFSYSRVACFLLFNLLHSWRACLMCSQLFHLLHFLLCHRCFSSCACEVLLRFLYFKYVLLLSLVCGV